LVTFFFCKKKVTEKPYIFKRHAHSSPSGANAIRGSAGFVSVLDTQMPNGECRYYLTDQVDSVNVVLNDKGDAITRTEYKPYGEIRSRML